MVKNVLLFYAVAFLAAMPMKAQSLRNAGTNAYTEVDSYGAVVATAQLTFRNTVRSYTQSTVSASDGTFRLTNIPANPYRLEVTAAGFNVFAQNVDVKNSIPVPVKATLAV